jgi:two-component system, OmpR family, sensor histidine kinase VicK
MSDEKTQAEKDILDTNQEVTKHEKTEMLIGAEATTKRVWKFFSNVSKKFDVCTSSAAPSIAMTIFRDAYEDMKSRGIKIRWITDITKDNLTHCKDLTQYAEVRHISSLNGNFGVSEVEYIAATTIDQGQPVPKLIYSNSKEMVEQQQYIFDIFWIKAIPAEHRIREIEQGIGPQGIEVIYDARQALELYQSLILSAEKEIKIVFPTTNALIRQDNAGILFLLQEAATAKKCQVKVLMPNDELIHNFIHDNSTGVSTRLIDQGESGKATILIIDDRVSLVMELKDDSKKTFHEAIGLSTYSNSKAGVLSYVSMFESLWKQTQLYEDLKSNEKMQKEFINIAAHELRTPIVPILNLSELLYSRLKGQQHEQEQEQQEEMLRMLETILRNANRLRQLTEDVLDATRIESHLLKLRKERFNLNDTILSVVEDYRQQITNDIVKVIYEGTDSITLVEADRRRLTQVVSNLLNNALKFTKDGTVTVTTAIERKGKGEVGGGEVIVSLKDTGTGIDPELMPRLFTKFATKSYQGTGLGLFIAKSIIEAHGGRIWAENNTDGKGATFYFTLPVVNMNEQTREEKEEARLVNDQLQ